MVYGNCKTAFNPVIQKLIKAVTDNYGIRRPDPLAFSMQILAPDFRDTALLIAYLKH